MQPPRGEKRTEDRGARRMDAHGESARRREAHGGERSMKTHGGERRAWGERRAEERGAWRWEAHGGRHAEERGARRREARGGWRRTEEGKAHEGVGTHHRVFYFRILVDKLLNGDWFYLDRLCSPDFLTAGPFFLPKFLWKLETKISKSL